MGSFSPQTVRWRGSLASRGGTPLSALGVLLLQPTSFVPLLGDFIGEITAFAFLI